MQLEPRYRVGMVAKLTGLSPHVLRVWERRYGAVQPQRTSKGGRLYSDADVRRLRQLSRLIRAGHSISTIAMLPDDALTALATSVSDVEEVRSPESTRAPADSLPLPTAPASVEGTQNLREQFLAAIEALDAERARRTIASAALLLPQRELLTQVVAPILEEVGRRWAAGRFAVVQEHAATATLRGILETLSTASSRPLGPQAVVSTPAGERHELGAMMAGILASHAGYRVTYLGPDLPASDLLVAIQRLDARLVLLSLVCMTAGEARARVDEVLKGLSGRDVRIVLGGAAAPDMSHPQVVRLPTLDSLITYLD